MSHKAAYCSLLLVLAFLASLVVPASAQHLKQVKGNPTSVAACRNEVFGVDGRNQVRRFEPSSKSFSKIAKASCLNAYNRHEASVLWCLVCPDLLTLKDEPRYQALIKKINFPAPHTVTSQAL